MKISPQPMLFPEFAAERMEAPVAVRRPLVRSTCRPPEPVVPPAARERFLPIRLGTDVTLVGMDTVRAVRGGMDADSVSALLDAGEWRWVWDLALPGSRRRELRFLAAEVLRQAPPSTETEAIRCVLGGTDRRPKFRAAQIEQMWVVSAQTVMRLATGGEFSAALEGRTRWIGRESLVAFLQRRLIRG